jgi:hypothetical protein
MGKMAYLYAINMTSLCDTSGWRINSMLLLLKGGILKKANGSRGESLLEPGLYSG